MEDLDEAVVLYRSYPFLGIEGLDETQEVVMQIACPEAGFSGHRSEILASFNEAEFKAIEEEVGRLCPNATHARHLWVEFEVLDESALVKLEAIIADRSDLFGCGLKRRGE